MQIFDLSSEKTYFTQIPNIIDDLGLTPIIFRFYIKLKRTAGDKGCCWKSTRTLAAELGVSIGTISKLKKELEKPFDLLGGKSLIRIEKGDIQKNETDRIYITDIWPENMLYFTKISAPCSSQETGVFSGGNTPVSWSEQKKNPIKKNPIKNPPPTSPKANPSKLAKLEEEEKIYACVKEVNLNSEERKRICKFPEKLVNQAIKYAYHPTTRDTQQHIGRIMHFLKNPKLYEEHMKTLDKPLRQKKPFLDEIKEAFKKGEFYQGYECLMDNIGIGFLKPGSHSQPYSVHWKDFRFKEKFYEILKKLSIMSPLTGEI